MSDRPSSPWVGLQPYTEQDRDYFHGRERDERIVSANLRTRRLTILYGASGIGKSSLLLAGVVPTVSEQRAVLVFRDWQGPEFLGELKRGCAELVRAYGEELDPEQPLDELLGAAARAVGKPVLMVFDQFEEYFVAHPPTADGRGFETELARAVNRTDVGAGFLLSLREDALAGMDRFQVRIPNLLGNLIRLEHLTKGDADHAIRESLSAWNAKHAEAVAIEDELIAALLSDVSPHERTVPFQTSTSTETAADSVEAPFLQLVLERLWDVERRAGHDALTLATYRTLGGAKGIVADHFDAILDGLTPGQRELCAHFFDRLVTPSGGKIAYPVADLQQLAGPLAPHLPSTLETLERARILRTTDTAGRNTVEIYHDVLAPTIVGWQAEIVRQHARALQRRQLRRRLATIGGIAAAILAVVAYFAYTNWQDARPWATLTDVGSGKAYRLHGAQILIGRDVPGYETDVSFPDHYVSRIHLILYRDGTALDLRSSNGTTVDGIFMRYGSGARKLQPGDLVVVAGTAVLRYEPIDYPFWHIWTPGVPSRSALPGWAAVVEGRNVRPLSGRPYFLTASGALLHGPPRPRNARAVVRWTTADGAILTDLSDGQPLRAQCTEPNGEGYPRGNLVDDGRIDGFTIGIPRSCVLLVAGRRIQIVPLRRVR